MPLMGFYFTVPLLTTSIKQKLTALFLYRRLEGASLLPKPTLHRVSCGFLNDKEKISEMISFGNVLWGWP